MSLRGHQRATAATIDEVTLLVVRFGAQLFALPADGVRGVLTPQEAGREQAVTWVGLTYHEADLAGRLATTFDASGAEQRTVLYASKLSHGAIRVEEVVGLVDVARNDCRPLPPHFRADERSWIVGYVLVNDQVTLILNPEWVLGELGEVVAPALAGARPALGASPAGDRC